MKEYRRKWRKENPNYWRKWEEERGKALRKTEAYKIKARERAKKWRARKTEAYLKIRQRDLEKGRIRSQENKNLLELVKAKKGCCNPDCQWQGDVPLVCLDFHHIDKKDKKFNLACSLRRSKIGFINEMNKCTVICANCHRLVTWNNVDASSWSKCQVSLDGEVV